MSLGEGPAPGASAKNLLGKLLRALRHSHTGITLNKLYEGDGTSIYQHACKLGRPRLKVARLALPIFRVRILVTMPRFAYLGHEQIETDRKYRKLEQIPIKFTHSPRA